MAQAFRAGCSANVLKRKNLALGLHPSTCPGAEPFFARRTNSPRLLPGNVGVVVSVWTALMDAPTASIAPAVRPSVYGLTVETTFLNEPRSEDFVLGAS
jgi:hypothetical protein